MKFIKLVGAIIIMISVVSCTNSDSNKKNNISSDFKEASSNFSHSGLSESSTQVVPGTTLKEIHDRLDNNTPINQLIKTEYSLDSLQKRFARSGSPFAGYALSIKEIDDTFPIECI